MVKCCISGCKSNYRKNYEGLSFFKFPKNKTQQKLWIDIIGCKNIKHTEILRVCSKHFDENYINTTLTVIRLKDDAVPTLFPFSSPSVLPKAASSIKTEDTVNETDPLEITSSLVQPEAALPIETEDTGNKTDPLEHMRSPESSEPIHTEQLQPSLRVLSENTAEESIIFTDKTKLKMRKLTKRVQDQQKKIKVLNQKCRRLTHKVHTYKNVIDELKNQNSSMLQKMTALSNVTLIKVIAE